ncbi:hypothetical protein B0T16DRAFT_453931 [Cercophora newfieldiana]|uniref:Rhodopsin domain-containing protein n=1 Tax=Cercophora newfieldiana TaxID=92897 RepID=A0AA40CU27_9PEZI|nr:hypothetical protein B0T16DRAFT_453931 [Cercophora newfieldiana]
MASPEEAANQFILEVWALQGVAYLVVGPRYFHRARTLGWQKLAWDDALMLLATIVYTAESVMGYLVVAYWKGLANNAMTDEQRATLDPDSQEYMQRVNGFKTHVVGMLYNTVLWLLKGCWAVYYARLTDGVHRMTLMVKGAYVIIPPTCEPAISTVQTVFVVMNTLTDFYLMAIPLPTVWMSKLPYRKRLVLFIMFGGGFLEMAFGILRCVAVLTLGNTDPALSGYWSVRESFVSFVLTNMPMVYPLVKSFYEKGLSSVGSKGGTKADISIGYRIGSIRG